MTKKETLSYVCSNCLAKFATWSGRCPKCSSWNSLEIDQTDLIQNKFVLGQELDVRSTDLAKKSISQFRFLTGIKELNQLLGGGLVKGSVNLFSGQPGIGKSTLLIQLANYIANDRKVLYISAEESVEQVNDRANRLKLISSNLVIVNSYSTDDILATIASKKFDLVIVDSIQTIACSWVNGVTGSISQITNSTQSLIQMAKKTATTLLIVGHVTKDGSIAGPKLLEHMVDVVIQLEGDRFGGFKILKSIKNRFGPTNEVIIFELTGAGFRIIDNPSKILLEERLLTSGSVVTAMVEGSRPILVEVQALVNPTNFGYPKRTTSGFDLNRLNLLIAVLEQRTKTILNNQDVFINIVGGLSIDEPAGDLAICLAIISALRKKTVDQSVLVFGEVGLSGEIRHVGLINQRVEEAFKQSFSRIIGPKYKKISGYYDVRQLSDALDKAFI